MKSTSFIYLSAKHYDGTVFETQVADWLKLYKENGIFFNYIHLFFYRELKKKNWKQRQEDGIRSALGELYKGHSYSFPSRGLFIKLNAQLWANKIREVSKDADQIVIFSRMVYGKEMGLLKKMLCIPVFFIYDSRAASVEENKYNAVKKRKLDKRQFDMFSHISFTECVTCQVADKIFSVSNVLKKYLMMNYGIDENKFFIYPCLSDQRKFYYDANLRKNIRDEHGLKNEHKVYLYAGGLYNAYHSLDEVVSFLDYVARKDDNARFFLLSRDTINQNDILEHYPALNGKFINKAVLNSEMVKYLNAADYGILFRENVPMNNVASPSKFAEYILCGLPTIISEGVGDYSAICEPNGLGVLIPEWQMKNFAEFDFQKLINSTFDRKHIAEYGKEHLSKQARLSFVIEQFKSF